MAAARKRRGAKPSHRRIDNLKTEILMMRRLQFAFCLLGLLLFAGLASAAPLPPTLKNDQLIARFGPRGLVAVEWRAARFTFASDEFSISLNGDRHDSEALPSPGRTASENRVSYDWAAGGFRI